MKLTLDSHGKVVIVPTIGDTEIGRQTVNPGTNSDLPPHPDGVTTDFPRADYPKTADAMGDFNSHRVRLKAAPSLEERAVIIDHMKQDAQVAQIESKLRQQQRKEVAEQQKQLQAQQDQEQKQIQQEQKAVQVRQKEVQARRQAAQKQQELKMKFDTAMAPLTKQSAHWATEYCKTASIPQLSVRRIYV